MPQFARPSSDVALDGWTNPSWSAIDEVTSSTADKTISLASPTLDELIVGLTTVTDPVSSVNHIVRYTVQKDLAGGAGMDLVVGLYQTNTLIASFTHTNLANGWSTISQTLTAAQADAITDYAALRLRFKANQV